MPLAILLAGVLCTAGLAAFVAHISRERDEARFVNAVQSASDLIGRRLDLYLATLRGGAALYAASDTVSREAFRAYADRLELQDLYPGIQGIGWSERISVAPERYAIRFLEPLDARNRAAIGYDMFSEETRRWAMARARDQGEAALSGKVRLVQEIYGREQAGFLLYVPVFRGGSIPDRIGLRRERLRGFVYAAFRADDLFDGIFGSEVPRVTIRVYDGLEPDPEALLHASGEARRSPDFTATRTLLVSGRPWTVTFASTPTFEASSPGIIPWAFFLGGLAASLWLYALSRGLVRARTAAESADRAKSNFLATMSHELRTPLNAIAGYVDLFALEIPGPLSPRQREFIERIRHAQRHLLGLINDVLNFSKLEAGRIEAQRRPVPVRAVIQEAEALVETQLAARSLAYRRTDGPDAVAVGDQEKIRQILLNLLSNAIKFTDPGGRVEIRWDAEDSLVRVEVRDTGIGIPEAHQRTIFDPFVQVDTDLTRTYHGSGLGLAISRQLARTMGGDLGVDSAPGRGSTFHLTLQRWTDAEEPS